MPTVFVCYRREDAAAYAGWLRESLVSDLGRENVFMDIDTIEPGADFDEVIGATLDRADVMLVVIGPHWLDLRDEQGMRRLDDPDDYVRLEVGSGLKRSIRVIPVLVGGTRVPKSDQLPEDLKKLSRRQAIELSDTRWSYDTERLVQSIRAGRVVTRPLTPEAEPKRHATPPAAGHAEIAGTTPPPVSAGRAAGVSRPGSSRPAGFADAHVIDGSAQHWPRTLGTFHLRERTHETLTIVAVALCTAVTLATYALFLLWRSPAGAMLVLLTAASAAICGGAGIVPVRYYRRESLPKARRLTLVLVPAATVFASVACLFWLYLPFVGRNVSIAAILGLLLGVAAASNVLSDWPRRDAGRVVWAVVPALTWLICAYLLRIFIDLYSDPDYLTSRELSFLWDRSAPLKWVVSLLGLMMGGSVGICLVKGGSDLRAQPAP